MQFYSQIPKKLKQNTCTKTPYISRMELSTSSIKKNPHIFSKKSMYYIPEKRRLPLLAKQ